MVKYKVYFQKMLEERGEEFGKFRKIHDAYELDPDKLQEEFNREGEKIMEIVREYEDKLCATTERGIYNKFSSGLAEKFQTEVRKHFPLIDHVGIIVKKFEIKKISLGS